MGHRTASAPCAVCSGITPSSKLCRVVIDGRTVLLCREHAALVASNMPRTFEELRALFREPSGREGAPARRSLIERRYRDDRRVFPPRPEGRRMDEDRRQTDRSKVA